MGALQSYNPATGEQLGEVATIRPDELGAVVADVAAVQPFWAQLDPSGRARYFERAAAILLDDLDQVTQLISAEQGKPITESHTMEVIPTIDGLRWIADNAAEILADEPIKMGATLFATKSAKFTYQPLGVVAVIAPWNYPWSIPFSEVAIALACGNGVVLKPAGLTPLIGERIRLTFEKAGLPEGLIRVVHGGPPIGQAICDQPGIAKVFFTGSVEVGYQVGEACARRMKGSVLELGGKDPQIVCADADLGAAVSGGVWGAFANSGQTCSAIERVYVVREVADRFIDSAVREAERLRVGDPSRWETEIGPMTSAQQYTQVCELVDDAIAAGAKRLCGGPTEPPGLTSGRFIAPTILVGVEPTMRIMQEEIFGPVMPITVVGDEAEAVALANDSRFGLGASVWTRDRAKGERIARQIESGMVWINDHSFSHAAIQTAWGGVKDSGLGRAHSRFGFYECVELKTITWEPGHVHDLWWHPYDETLGKALRSVAAVVYGRGGERVTALREGGGSVLRAGLRSAIRSLRGGR